MDDSLALNAGAEAEGRQLLLAAFETAHTGDLAAEAGLVDRLRRHSRRRRRMRALLPAGAAAAAAGAVAASLALTATITGAPSALAAVASAAARTSAQSFHVTAVSTLTAPARHASAGIPPLPRRTNTTRVNGMFDRGHARGEETMAGQWTGVRSTSAGWEPYTFHWGYQVRYIGGHTYLRYAKPSPYAHGKHWLEGLTPRPWPPAATSSQIARGFLDGQPIDPAQLLGLLKSAGSVTDGGPASGPGWTGTVYTFTVRLPASDHTTMTGTAYVDRQGRVRRLVTVTTELIPGRAAAAGASAATPAPTATASVRAWSPGLTTTEDVTFSDFGSPVPVSAPPASDTYNLHTYMTNLPGAP